MLLYEQSRTLKTTGKMTTNQVCTQMEYEIILKILKDTNQELSRQNSDYLLKIVTFKEQYYGLKPHNFTPLQNFDTLFRGTEEDPYSHFFLIKATLVKKPDQEYIIYQLGAGRTYMRFGSFQDISGDQIIGTLSNLEKKECTFFEGLETFLKNIKTVAHL